MISNIHIPLPLWQILCAGCVLLALVSCRGNFSTQGTSDNPLAGKVVCLDPGHGGTADIDSFRVGPGGEREEWINLRVALLLKEMLEESGARVVMTRTEDVQVELSDRALLAVENEADVFLSIHHNATADSVVNFPIVYFHGNASENAASIALGRILARNFRDVLFDGESSVSLASDHAIFPGSGASVLRNSYGIPGVIGEASFFSNAEEERRLKDSDFNRKEAQAYLSTLTEFFSHEIPPIADKYSQSELPPFPVLEEDERMQEEARSWFEFYRHGLETRQKQDRASLEEAYDLFTRSARAFPDSSVAQACHRHRAEILAALGDVERAEVARRRAEEHYVAVE
ncbi:MAG: N-acetylmuramoyl-L-alanine amidase [Acidobacteriota bacterium]|nr:N-acetylmuramoyl-L-alanine amidase [Acidobacteriota bacterium]